MGVHNIQDKAYVHQVEIQLPMFVWNLVTHLFQNVLFPLCLELFVQEI